MELAPELQFKHYTLAEAQLPAEAVVNIDSVGRDEIAICCDLVSHVFNPEHTDTQVAEALRVTHWFDLREWSAGRGRRNAPEPAP
jgi:hypothetical protein